MILVVFYGLNNSVTLWPAWCWLLAPFYPPKQVGAAMHCVADTRDRDIPVRYLGTVKNSNAPPEHEPCSELLHGSAIPLAIDLAADAPAQR